VDEVLVISVVVAAGTVVVWAAGLETSTWLLGALATSTGAVVEVEVVVCWTAVVVALVVATVAAAVVVEDEEEVVEVEDEDEDEEEEEPLTKYFSRIGR
jgi:hypothetical protein